MSVSKAHCKETLLGCLLVYLPICRYRCQENCQTVCLSVYKALCKKYCLAVYLSQQLSVKNPIYLSLCMSPSLCVKKHCLDVYLSTCLSVATATCQQRYRDILYTNILYT